MKWSSFAAAALFAAASVPATVASDVVYSVHGSGTTNPSKCVWMQMSNFMDRAKRSIHLTYRAVGSSTGIAEFIGVDTENNLPNNDFGSGDIPVSTEKYEALKAKGIEMVHLPFVMGAISLFHNVPGVPEGTDGLNLTSCLISKIFKRDITVWDDDEIVAINPHLKDMLPKTNFPIKVARRVHGSSSTASVTQYLHVGCPSEWPEEMVGKVIDWADDTMECEGSGGMTTCIRETEGAIGYIDAGHGIEEGLIEIELKNAAGNHISSKRAKMFGGIGAAASSVPSSADADFGGVSLLNKPGEWTWPIVAMSYIYVRKDLPSFMDDPIEQSILKAFLKYTLLDKEEIKDCERFGFTPVPDGVREVALGGLEMLQMSDGAPEWLFEEDTIAGKGQGIDVVSLKRRSFAEYERSTLDGTDFDEDMISDQVEGMVNDHMATLEIKKDEKIAADGGGDGLRAQTQSSSGFRMYTEADAQKLQAALVMSAISISFWALAIIALISKKMCG